MGQASSNSARNFAVGATTGTLWSAVDKFGIVVMQFVINVVLARLLTPDDFGIVGMILIIVAVSNILADGGFGAALIQKQNPTESDFSTTFYVNIIAAIVLYATIYIASPAIANFLGIESLVDILRVLSSVVIINAFGLVAKVKLRRALAFKQIAASNIAAYVLAAAAAIYLAHRGFGAWGLVAMHIVNALFANTFLCIAAGWRPSLLFSRASLKELFAYGEYMLISDILSNICFHIQSTLVGKYFSPYTAGQYAQAKKMEEVACITLPSAMNQVLFPLYSRLQDDRPTLQRTLSLNTRIIAWIIFPLMTILIIIAKPLILLLFGAKWIDAVLYFQVLCAGGYFCALQYFNYHAVAALGHSRVLFYAGIWKSLFLIVAIMVGVRISMEAVLVAMVLTNVVNYLTNAILAQRYVGYRVMRQLGDVAPIMLLSLALGALAYAIFHYTAIHWVALTLLYAIAYVAINGIAKNEVAMLAIEYIKRVGRRDDNNATEL